MEEVKTILYLDNPVACLDDSEKNDEDLDEEVNNKPYFYLFHADLGYAQKYTVNY